MRQAVIATGGKQYVVKEGDILEVERLDAKKTLTLTPLSVFEDGKLMAKQGSVKASVLAESKAAKIVVFKMKPKKRYRRKAGHRQLLTKISIDKITV